jgi:RNA-directed DNA polymerase
MTIYDILKTPEADISALDDINKYYLSYALRKKSGKPRWIDAPQEPLKTIQNNILRNILYKFSIHDSAVGFAIGRSVVTGAKRHVGNKALLCMDLHNYFNNIKINRIHRLMHFLTRRLEERDPSYQRQDEDASILTKLVSFKQQLPQGSPTSPAIANLITLNMDRQLFDYCKGNDIIYTRYADDTSFSHKNKNFDFYKVIADIIGIITDNGFVINKKKTRVMRPHKRMSITGVVINEKLGVPKWKWRNFRARLHNLEKEGNPITLEEYQELRGYSEWIKTLHPKRGNKFLMTLGKLTLTSS